MLAGQEEKEQDDGNEYRSFLAGKIARAAKQVSQRGGRGGVKKKKMYTAGQCGHECH